MKLKLLAVIIGLAVIGYGQYCWSLSEHTEQEIRDSIADCQTDS